MRWGCLAGACGIAGALACAGAGTPAYVPASEHSVDLYADLPPAPSGRITNGEDALTLALRDEALLRHLRRVDANYSGRRREHLDWNGAADFRTEPDGRAKADPDDGPSPLASALGEAIKSEGGYWLVRLSSDVRETSIFYVCELRIAPSGRPLASFEPKQSCGWRNP